MVRFHDRKRRKTGITTGWLGRLGGAAQTEEEVCWEEWCVQVIVARPRSEAGWSPLRIGLSDWIAKRRDDRPNQSPPRHGVLSAEDGNEDRCDREQRQGSYTAHHHERSESVSLQDYRQSQATGRRERFWWRLELIARRSSSVRRGRYHFNSAFYQACFIDRSRIRALVSVHVFIVEHLEQKYCIGGLLNKLAITPAASLNPRTPSTCLPGLISSLLLSINT